MKQLGLLAVLLGACGGSDGDEIDNVATSMEGIYAVQTFTLNDTACAPGGESALGEHRFALAVSDEIFGTRILSVLSCNSIAECRELHALLEQGQGSAIEFSFGGSELGPDGTLIGNGASTGFQDGEVCTGGEVTHTVLALAGSTLTIDQETTFADDFPVDAEGFCTTDGARDAAAGKTCSQRQQLTATFVEAL